MTDTPQPTRKEREAERHRREILDVAAHLFAEHGYHETTMQMVADAAEFSVGYLYKHFQGKEEMYGAMVGFHIAIMDEIIDRFEKEHLPPLEELRATYEAICTHFNDHRDFMRIYHQRLATEAPELVERKQKHHEDMIDIFERAMAAGEMKPVDARVLGSMVQGASQELFHELAERDNERPFDELPDTIFGLMIDPLRIS